MEPLIKDTPVKDTIEILLRTEDKVQCTKWRLSYSSNIFLTSDKGQPLKRGQSGQKTMGPKRVRYLEVSLYITTQKFCVLCFHTLFCVSYVPRNIAYKVRCKNMMIN